MKIAVTYEDGNVFQHFGHTRQFKIYTAAEGKIQNAEVVDTMCAGHGALVGFLSARQVDALICGGSGGSAQDALAQAGIRLFAGFPGPRIRRRKRFWPARLDTIPRCAAAIMTSTITRTPAAVMAVRMIKGQGLSFRDPCTARRRVPHWRRAFFPGS